MKTLVNKRNSQILITAPEIEISKLFDGSKVYWIPSIHELCGSFSQDHWALVEEEPTCRSCGFYENNCPFIRGKFVPYPSRVCKDYIHSAMKEQEQPEVDLEKVLELLEKHLELFTAGNLDRRKGYTKHDMQDAFILGFKAGIKRR